MYLCFYLKAIGFLLMKSFSIHFHWKQTSFSAISETHLCKVFLIKKVT